MTHYIKHGTRYQILPHGALDATELLPLGTYKVGYMEPADDYFLEKIEDFEPVGKVYGRTLTHRDRILSTFDQRPAGTGVLLSGEKGSGKTLLAKLLSLEAQEKGIPTIVITQPHFGDTFNKFIQSIDQAAVVIFDEFEKVYDKDKQERLLTLLDGVFPTKKLFILTVNDRYRVNENMTNRPGRLFYRIDYAGLEAEFIREYCVDNLENQEHVESVVRTSRLFSRFNFDILKALVEEMNRYGEDAETAGEILNAKPELGAKHTYTVSLVVAGKAVPKAKMHSAGGWHGNPLTDEVHVYYQGVPEKRRKKVNPFALATAPTPEELQDILAAARDPEDADDDRYEGDEEEEMVSVRFRPADLKRVDAETGIFIFQRGDIEGSLVEKASTKFDYSMVY